jgi:hypothetical protein
MIQPISGLPENVAGFRASGIVTKEDFDSVVSPAVERIAKKFDKLNFLVIMDTEMKNFTLGAWVQDAWLGLKHLTQWHRLAFVGDSEAVKKTTAIMDRIAPGKFRAFPKADEAEAINWVSAEPVESL